MSEIVWSPVRSAARKIFVAGSTGAIGRLLIPELLGRGHSVTALVRTVEKGKALVAAGATIEVVDPFDRTALTNAVKRSAPDVIVHQLTSLGGAADLKHFDEQFAVTNRMRTEVTDTLIAAARRAEATRSMPLRRGRFGSR